MQTLAVTVRQFEISSGVCSRFKPLLTGPLLRFWKMDQFLPGVMHSVVVTVRQFETSWSACSRFKPPVWPLLQFCKMDLSLPGVMHAMAVTVSSVSTSAQGCAADSSRKSGLCCDSGRWIRRCLGWCRQRWWQFFSSTSAQECAADSGR